MGVALAGWFPVLESPSESGGISACRRVRGPMRMTASGGLRGLQFGLDQPDQHFDGRRTVFYDPVINHAEIDAGQRLGEVAGLAGIEFVLAEQDGALLQIEYDHTYRTGGQLPGERGNGIDASLDIIGAQTSGRGGEGSGLQQDGDAGARAGGRAGRGRSIEGKLLDGAGGRRRLQLPFAAAAAGLDLPGRAANAMDIVLHNHLRFIGAFTDDKRANGFAIALGLGHFRHAFGLTEIDRVAAFGSDADNGGEMVTRAPELA